MGVGGTLEYLSDLMGSSGHKHKKKKQLQTVELKVRMDCDGCELKVKNALSSLSGMNSIGSFELYYSLKNTISPPYEVVSRLIQFNIIYYS